VFHIECYVQNSQLLSVVFKFMLLLITFYQYHSICLPADVHGQHQSCSTITN